MQPNMPLKFQLDRLNLRPVRARGKSDSKTDSKTDRHTDGLSKTTFLDVLGVVHPKSGLISMSIFLHDANTSIDMEVIPVYV